MFDDTGHRPHADHRGETPHTQIARGPEALSVQLMMWEPKHHIDYVYNALQSNWGESPSRIWQQPDGRFFDHDRNDYLTPAEVENVYAYVVKCFAGGTLPQILEEFRFHFVIDGVSRACTHQLVRTRGADVMQHGGRDNDWRFRGWTMPETIARACDMDEGVPNPALADCITDWQPIRKFLEMTYPNPTLLRTAIEDYLDQGKHLYSALVDAGIPWQDARRLLWMGTQTYLHIGYNYLDLQRTLSNRLEHIMDWEFNCVAQLMLREVRMLCPGYMWRPLKSISDKAEKAMFAGLTSWPPDGKWPNPFARCSNCGWDRDKHDTDGVCMRDSSPARRWSPVDSLPRAHRAEQMPFWVLSPESMAGGPIKWIPTNGTYPQEARISK